jgi:transaldolase
LLREGKAPKEIYEALAMTDERTVADLLRPTYERTNGQDGFVSIEVSPYLAQDTERTLSEVRRFWKTIDRPNLMVKIPATPAGVPAIHQALADVAISYDQVTRQMQEEGVQKFIDSFHTLFECIDKKRKVLQQ